MRKIFTLFVAALFLLALPMRSMGQTRTEATITFADLGFENGEDVDGLTFNIDDNVTVTFNKANGNNGPKYYNTGTAIRAYAGNTIVLAAETGMITGIVFTPGSGDGGNDVTSNTGTTDYPAWTGSTGEVIFTIGGTSGHRRVAAITVTYQTDANMVTAPVLSPGSSTIYQPTVTVTATCATEGATIRYTTDGNDPTESSTTFPANGLTLSQTTTVKARAYKSGMTPSTVTAATYTFQTVQMYPNIAAWKAAHTETDATISGISGNLTAVFQNGINLFVQDGTGGLLIYGSLNQTYNSGDVISGGIVGTSSLYHGLMEFVPTQSPAAGVPGTPVVPADVTAAEIEANFSAWESKLVKLTDVAFTEDHVFNTTNTAGRTAPFVQGQVSMNVYDNFKVLNGFEVHEGQEADLIGFVSVFDDTKQINPRSTDDIQPYDAPQPTVSTPVFDPNGGLFTEPVSVTLTCATEGATIYYSLGNGANWTAYTAPIQVSESGTLQAYATKADYIDSDVVSAEFTILEGVTMIFNQDWEGDWNGWTEQSVSGTPQWEIGVHSGNHYAVANAYNEGACEDWLISPAFNINAYADVRLTFRTAMNFTGPDLEVYFSSDYNGSNPSDATWLPLTASLSEGGWNWVVTDAINLDNFSGNNCYIGFKYTSTESEAAGWEVDDIILYCSGMSGDPLLQVSNASLNMSYVYGEGPSPVVSYTLTGNYLQGSGEVFVEADGPFEVSLNGTAFMSDFSIPYENGELEGQPVTIYVRMNANLEIGDYQGSVSNYGGGASIEVALNGNVLTNLVASMNATLPMYIQGNNGSNNNRVPVSIPVSFSGLQPNATYRYVNQFIGDTDGPEVAGAGNVIFVNPSGFTRTTNPSLATDGAYGTFTTNASGEAIVWLVNEPTANNRFTPGNSVYLRVRLNDGANGTEVAHILTSTDYATVLNFGTDADATHGSAFYVRSNEPSKSMAMLFAGVNDERPVFTTPVETTGIDYTAISQYASFYKEEVAGKNGYFGGIVPNVNNQGIKKMVVMDLQGNVANQYLETETLSFAELTNPQNGHSNPIFIDLVDQNVMEAQALNVTLWNANHVIVVDNQEVSALEMTVYNVLGQAVMQHVVAAESREHIAHALSNGLYVILLRNATGAMSVKTLIR
jgi:hypothetical protein